MRYDYDVVIMGAGSAGMVAGEVAAKIGVKAALAERDRLGGRLPLDGLCAQQGASRERQSRPHGPPGGQVWTDGDRRRHRLGGGLAAAAPDTARDCGE